MEKKIQSPILITGAARSGTSLIAGMINRCGAWGGKMSGPNLNNKKGMYENSEIRNNVVKPYLREIGVDPMGQFPLPDPHTMNIPNNWRSMIHSVIGRQGYNGGPWFYKGAKMCLMWPVWQHAFPNAKWVIVRRRTGDIVSSCIKTGFMRAFSDELAQRKVNVQNEADGWKWWVHQHENRFIEMITEGLNVQIVWPERLVYGDYTQLMNTIEWLGLKWNPEALKFVDEKLWKARKK
jgi:hypothetical protein